MTDTKAGDQIPPGEPFTEFTFEPWTPQEVARRLAGTSVPWAFAAGWALELFLGSVNREHEDIEIAVPQRNFDELQRALLPYEFDLVGSVPNLTPAGRKWPVSDRRAFEMTHQTWLREPATGVYRLDVFREPGDENEWVFRRDPSIRRPCAEVVRHTADGLPYLAPEVVLLFKARWSSLPKNEGDLNRTLPLLDAASTSWLRESIEQVHPGHEWLDRLDR